MYEYQTPDGYGDTFFIYNVNGEDIPLVNGNSYTLVGIPVQDGMFVCRVWSGGVLIVNATTGTVQMYDGVRNAWFQLPILQGNVPPSFAVLPEKVYRDNTALRFDLTNANLNVNSNGAASVYADQMAWYGVKRIQGGASDPLKSNYKYYEKPFAYPVPISLTNYGPSGVGGVPIPGLSAPTQYTQLIQDFDFELRRISVAQVGGSGVRATLILVNIDINVTLSFTAVTPGVGGNSITLEIGYGVGDNVPQSISVIGNAVVMTLPTDGSGNPIIQNASTVADALNADPSVTALFTSELASADGATPTVGHPVNFTGGSGSGGGGGLTAYASPFKILLYDATWRQRSTEPLLSELLCHNPSTVPPASSMPNNSWPSPPLMYPVNSVIRFDIFSLIPTGDALPVTVVLTFEGVRRINC